MLAALKQITATSEEAVTQFISNSAFITFTLADIVLRLNNGPDASTRCSDANVTHSSL